MLEYLVTSDVRRRLLTLLWAGGVHGSISELADRADVNYASAHRELKLMAQANLARSHHEAGREVFRANRAHPSASLLRQLVTADAAPASGGEDPETAQIRGRLKSLGAPLHVEPVEVEPEQVMRTLVDGVRAARRDATVARCLPLCFWAARDHVNAHALRAVVRGAEDKHAVGLFLELTTLMSGDERFAAYAESLRDARVRAERDFFTRPASKAARKLARLKTPEVARRWGFLLNMDLESFRSTFNRFATT